MKIRQLFADAYECTGPLDDADTLHRVMRESIERVGATVLDGCVTRFQPHGVTNVLVLAESHFVVSTWPEHGYAAADVLLCNEDMDALEVWRGLKEYLKPGRETTQWVVRHAGLDGAANTPADLKPAPVT